MTKSIVNAKEAEKVKEATKVYGFIGIPDTHSLETYLKWKQINYERVHVNPLKIEDFFAETDCDAKTPFDIPVLEEKGVFISGSSLIISILESQENFAKNNEFFSLEELKKRFPKIKVAWQTMESALNKFLYTQEKVMNRCWTLHPIQDKLDEHMDKETLRFHKITKRANKARTLADEELKPLLLHSMHLDYTQSFRNTSKFYENVDLPVYSKHLTLASYAHARRSNYKDYLSGRKKVIESGEIGADHGTLMGFESEGIWNEIASKIADLGLG